MKKYLAFFLLMSSSTFAATLNFSEELVPLQVNDLKVEQSFFRSVDKVEVATGQHKLKIKYKDLYEVDYDEHEVIESKPFWVVVDVSDDSAEYLISMPRPDDIEAAKVYITKPYANIKELGKDNHNVQLQPVNEQVVLTNHQAAPSLVVAPVATKVETAPVISPAKSTAQIGGNKKPAAPVSQQPSALSMLEFWWRQASDVEKESFLKNKKGN